MRMIRDKVDELFLKHGFYCLLVAEYYLARKYVILKRFK